MTQEPARSAAAVWAARVLGALLVLIGAILAIGGGWLLAIGGSPYYLLAGVGLLVSGVLLLRGRMSGVWIYLAVFVATVVWALWEVGLQGWPLVPRLFGPSLLALLVLLVGLGLARDRGQRTADLGALTAFGLFVVAGSAAVFFANRPAAAGQLPASGRAAGVTQAAADWPAYGGDTQAQRYSALTQITPQNVGRLKRFWVAHTGDLPSAEAKGTYGAETTPLKVGSTVYLCTPKNMLIALDAATGKQRWRYDPKVPDRWIPYTAACRGVTYIPAATGAAVPAAQEAGVCSARIAEGTIDGRLIEVDAATGQPCADFGRNGQVDIKDGMGPVVPGMVAITSPPVLVRGMLVTGHEVLDGQKNDAPSGVIQAYDARTGELKWAWDLGAPDRTGAPPPDATYTRGTPNVWSTATGDEALGLVYLPMGNSAVDYWSHDRSPQENQFSSSLVALDVTTGKPAWRFQTVHKDVWDYDLGSQPTLVDLPTPQGPRPALVLASKQGEIYVLDRRTGQPITGVQERRVPQGGVEPAERSPTQPFSLFHTLRKPVLRERDMWGMSPIDQMICRIQFRQSAYRGPYTPPETDRRWIEYPGYNGGSDWGSLAVDPVRGVIVANYNDMPNYNRLIPRAVADRKGWAPRGEARGGSLGASPEGAGDPQMGAPYAIDVNAGWRMPFTKLLCKQPPYGGIRAIDLRTGRTIWDRPLGEARENGPFGLPSGLPIKIGTPNNGGPLVTASGLVFIAAASDNLIRAIDLRTGKVVWKDTLPGGGQATPMTYEANGRQYLLIMAGGHHFMETPVSDALVAYALPGR